MKDMIVDTGLVELEACLVNGGVQLELCDTYNGYRTTITLSSDEIRKLRDVLNTALESEDDT